MRINKDDYDKMPADIRAMFYLAPNPARDEVLALFPDTGNNWRANKGDGGGAGMFGVSGGNTNGQNDTGSAARFFYCAKASKRDRDEGLDGMEEKQYSHDGREKPIENPYQRNNSKASNTHPTVKPTDLMRYLCRLITPPNGVVLDPFMGSGSTGKGAILEGFGFVGIELEGDYFEIARRRIEFAEKQWKQLSF